MMGIAEKFEQMKGLLAKKAEMKRDLKAVDSEISTLRTELKENIPEEGAVDGIAHHTHEHKNVSYEEVLKVVIREVIPPAKQPRAWAILDRMTEWVKTHSFEPALPE